MKRTHLFACLLVCLVMLGSCKKDQMLEKSITDDAVVRLNDFSSTKSRCLTDKRMEVLYLDRSGYRSEIIQGRTLEMIDLEKNTSRNADELPLLTIPVHVIIVHRPGHPIGNQTNLSNERIHSQIAALNRDFLRKNADANKTPAVFKVSAGQIQFCLASIDPKGQSTNGISRYATSQNFDNNELTIKKSTRWDPRRYLNIWVAPDIEGLGYAYLPTPTSLPSIDEDGVVILSEAFGGPNSGATAPFNLGRTVTHEVGHYLGLDHIWGDGCQVDDGITDTPSQAEENYDCPTHPSPSCNNQGDMFMNYMDYTDDGCMNAFSSGQVAYMRRILTTSRAQLITPGRTTCPAGILPTPTCSDGIKNGNETGIDCGGTCAPCQTATGVDAGITGLTHTIQAQQCTQSVRFNTKLTNFGSTVLNSVIIEVRSASGQLINYTWKGTLASKASVNVALPETKLVTGSYQVTAATKSPNGKTDSNTSNDKITASIKIEGLAKLTLLIQPDEFAADISWKIKDSQGKVVASGGGYSDGNMTLIKESLCLPVGCYRLTMSDSYGDGICCDYGEGWYELRSASGKVLLDSDGYYGTSETQNFCLDTNSSLSRQKIEREPRLPQTNRRLVTNAKSNVTRN